MAPLFATTAHAAPAPELQWHVGGAETTWRFWQRVWQYRDLWWLLALRELQIRYRQTAVGMAWAVIQPLATLAVFTLLFGLLGKRPSDEQTPYWLVVLTGLLPWQFFAFVVQQSAASLVGNQALITKASFPRQLLPLSTVLTGAVDFAITGTLLLLALAWNGRLVPTLLLAPVFLVLIVATGVALGLLFAALNALYRDLGQVLPLFMQLLFYATPVVYQGHVLVPAGYRSWWALNPLASGLEAWRWACLGTPFPAWNEWLPGLLVCMVLLWGGTMYFRKVDRSLADRI